MGETSVDLSTHTPIVDYPYPRQLITNIQKGKPVEFPELINTGMVISYIFFNQKDLQDQINTLKTWASHNQTGIIAVDFDDEQKQLDRLIEIHRNNGKIDHDGLSRLFEKICIYSSQLSEHISSSTLITSNTIEITFGNGAKAWYFVMSSHPDLIAGKRLDQYCDDTLSRLHQNLRKSVKQTKTPKRQNFTEQQKTNCREKQEGKCNKCGKHPPRWEYNHKDGDRTNNTDSNIEALCPNCHSVVTYDES
jgi:hypothetical protein